MGRRATSVRGHDSPRPRRGGKAGGRDGPCERSRGGGPAKGRRPREGSNVGAGRVNEKRPRGRGTGTGRRKEDRGARMGNEGSAKKVRAPTTRVGTRRNAAIPVLIGRSVLVYRRLLSWGIPHPASRAAVVASTVHYSDC